MLAKTDLVAIRPYEDGDRAFILATWLRGLFYSGILFKLIPKDIFMRCYHPIIERIMERSVVLVACLKDDPQVILGYSVLGDNCLHWVFVKDSWRHIGIARDLVPTTTKFVTHLTQKGWEIAQKKGLLFNPFLL